MSNRSVARSSEGPVQPPRTAEAVQVLLIEELASRLGIDPHAIDPRERFSRYGLDSHGAAGLLTTLSARLDHPLSPTLVWDYPTIDTLSRHLSTEGAESSPAPTARARPPRAGGRSATEPVAIVGLACRFPKAPSKEAFWRLLRDGGDAITKVPSDRWNGDALYDRDISVPGKMNTRWGGFLDRIDGFEPLFFGISPREAILMDPQQRLMLELSWEALEDAGLPPEGLKGSATGVFFGVLWTDYATLAHNDGLKAIAQHTTTGFHHCIVANRVSYVLGLEGPSLSVDTACSYSLVAVHLAAESLRRGESTLALAGGVNLNIIPESTMGMSKFGGLSPDGRCFTFDARANGYVRGEGGGVVVLKPLSQALADGDPIYCVIAGDAVNNDGASNGLTAPNPRAQEDVLRRAYEQAGVDPAEVDYVEAHGSATQLGDPIEAKALGLVLGAGRPADRPLIIGSVKTNIGHLEAAAGIAGLIKVALSIKHQAIPPSLHFETPNHHISFADLRLSVQRTLAPWPDTEKLLTAGVSSFGYGGTNSHAVLQEWRPYQAEVLALSEDSPEALSQAARRWVERAAHLPLRALCRAAAALPSGGGQRLAVTARSRAELVKGLESFLGGEPRAGLSAGTRDPSRAPGLVFVFSGHGSQWEHMGRSLLETEPVFRATLERCDELVQRHLGWSLLDQLAAGPDTSRFDEIDITCPTVVALEIALSTLWRSWGVEPSAVVGYSIGEVAAAHCAGILSLEDAMLVICTQGRFFRRIRGRGTMGLVSLPWEQAGEAIAGYEGRLCRAIHASPDSTVLAGDAEALSEVLGALERRNVFCRRVKTDVACHSPQLDALRDEIIEMLREVDPGRALVPVVSTVTGRALDGRRFDARHWMRNIADPSLFSEAMGSLVQQGFGAFLEIGPHPVAKHAIESCLAHADRAAVVFPTLRRQENERTVILDTLGALYTLGQPVRWNELYPAEPEATEIFALESSSDAPKTQEAKIASEGEPVYALPLSARSKTALEELALSYHSFLTESAAGACVRDIAYTASLRRSHHDHRLAAVGSTREELAASLVAALHDKAALPRDDAPAGSQPGVVFVFSGQGSQWAGMGRELFGGEPVFRHALERCEALLKRHVSWSLIDELTAPAERSRLQQTEIAQPALFALQVALVALWKSWGISPDAVVGHSVGEIAAACVAGALSLEDAISLVYHRGRLMQNATGLGRMASIEASVEQATRALEGYEDLLSIAAINDPGSVVLSGDGVALEQVMARLEREKAHGRLLRVNYAFHSPQMAPFQAELVRALGGLTPLRAALPMLSTVTGAPLTTDQLDMGYWADNIRKPVQLARALDTAISQGYRLFLEVGPHPVLLDNIQQCLAHRAVSGRAFGSLRREREERRALLGSLAALYTHGRTVDWKRLYPTAGRCVTLPSYPWQRERYWVEAGGAGSAPRASVQRGAAAAHPLLGAHFTVSTQPGAHFWEHALGGDPLQYLNDHRVQGVVVLPGAAYVELALTALAELRGAGAHELKEVVFERMLILPAQGQQTLQVVLTEDGPNRAALQVFCRHEPTADRAAQDSWVRHVTAKLLWWDKMPEQLAASETPDVIQQRCPTTRTGAEVYRRLAERGLSYGPAFQGVEQLWCGPLHVDERTLPTHVEALGRIRLPEVIAGETGYQLHPALLDACLHVLVELFPSEGTLVPVAIEQVRLHQRPGTTVWAHCRPGQQELTADLLLRDDRGQLLAELQGLRVQRLKSDSTARPTADPWLYAREWQRKALSRGPDPKSPANDGAWLLFSDQSGIGSALWSLLHARGEPCVRVVVGERYNRIEPGLFQINPARPEDIDILLRDAFGGGQPCRGVVHLFSLDATAAEDTTVATLQADQQLGCLSALSLTQALLRQGFRDVPRLWLVTRGALQVGLREVPVAISQAPLWGIGHVIALEHPELACTRVDLDPASGLDQAQALLHELGSTDGEDQIALRLDGRHVARLVQSSLDADETAGALLLEPAHGRPFRLEIRDPGVIENLTLRQVERRPPGPGEVEIEVEAAGLNFLDVLLALGVLPDDAGDKRGGSSSNTGARSSGPRLGAECAGRIVALGPDVHDLELGQEVLALATSSFGSFVTTKSLLVAPKPRHLTFEEAATLPLAFLTVVYSLSHVARLRAAERVLIHAGAGGVGLAAIQWAQHIGAQIFATAGSDEKRSLLRSLGVQHVMDSRSLRFADEVMRITDGDGVDVVLNSLSGDFISTSFELLRDHGRFVEIGKRDYYQNNQLGLRPFLRNLSFSLVDLRAMILYRPEVVSSLLKEVVRLFEEKTLRPVPIRSFPIGRAAEAFHCMAQARHIGKIALSVRDPEARIVSSSSAGKGFVADATYLIAGGLGGLGLSVAQWMISRGARNIVLLGRSAASSEAAEAVLSMERAGARIKIARADISRSDQIDGVFTDIERSMPPLRGIIHSAAVLDDATVLHLTPERVRRVLSPKVEGAWNLHVRSLRLPLDFFVLFSSALTLLGSPGQGNYVAANAFLDALAYTRHAAGLPALSINWGPWAEVGLAAAQANRGERLASRGIESMSPKEALEMLGRLLERAPVQMGVVPFNVRQWLQFYPRAAESPLFALLSADQGGAGALRASKAHVRQALLSRQPGPERRALLESHLQEQIAQTLRLNPSQINPGRSLSGLGFDSLLFLEIRRRLEVSLGIDLPTSLLWSSPSITAFASQLGLRMEIPLDAAPSPPAEAPPAAATLEERSDGLDAFSEDDMAALLAAELAEIKQRKSI